jgi:hypothetical protein
VNPVQNWNFVGMGRSSTSFKPGPDPKRGHGRKKGVPERNTRILRDALILAAEIAGGGNKDGLVTYLSRVAVSHPASFVNVLGKVLPLEIKTNGASHITIEVVRRFEPLPLIIEHKPNGKSNGKDKDPAAE